MIGKLVVYLRTHHKEALGLEEFLALGLVALAYGAAQVVLASGFLAVFAAGLALQRIKESDQQRRFPNDAPAGLQGKEAHLAVATHPELAGAYMTQAVRGFDEQLERIAELVIVLVVGAMLPYTDVERETIIFPFLLFVVLRLLSVWPGLASQSLIGALRKSCVRQRTDEHSPAN